MMEAKKQSDSTTKTSNNHMHHRGNPLPPPRRAASSSTSASSMIMKDNKNNNNINATSRQQQQQLSTHQPTSIAPSAPAFVDRMMQRTKEREESRKQLLQKYEEEKQARIAQEIREAEEDAQKTLAERTRAAKLREKMQRKMRDDHDRKEKLEQLDVAREKLADALCHRHFIGHVAFYPWRRYLQLKQRSADLLHDRQILRATFSRLKENVRFNQKLRETIFVTRCVGLTRVLRKWTMRMVMTKLRQNVLASRRDVVVAKKRHLLSCLRKWNRRALRHRVVSEANKEEWAEVQCVEADRFRSQMKLRQVFRRWNAKLDKKRENQEREKIRSRMWQIAMSALDS